MLLDVEENGFFHSLDEACATNSQGGVNYYTICFHETNVSFLRKIIQLH